MNSEDWNALTELKVIRQNSTHAVWTIGIMILCMSTVILVQRGSDWEQIPHFLQVVSMLAIATTFPTSASLGYMFACSTDKDTVNSVFRASVLSIGMASIWITIFY